MWHAIAMLSYDVYNFYGSNCTNVVQYLTILMLLGVVLHITRLIWQAP